MNNQIKVGIIGDFDPNRPSHIPTNEALKHSAKALSGDLEYVWLPTESLDDESCEKTLKDFDALFCAPGSPCGG